MTNSHTFQAAVFLTWRNGHISLGKMAELIQIDKSTLRGVIANMGLPIIDYPASELEAELEFLLGSGSETNA